MQHDPGTGTKWWHRSVGYEVYIRSFGDGDGDGVGDLQGVIDHLDQLAWLGIGTIWITPCFVSPMHDHGYDVADYTDIDPEFGDLATYRRLCEEAEARGIRVLADLVPNHTSSDHPWFQAARHQPDGPYRDYYIWKDPAPDGGPPNNWLAHFGGPAWTLDEASGQYWCHLFLPEQPDLNWANEAVREEFDRILEHWLGQGAAGFRVDVAHSLTKHPSFADLPMATDVPERSRDRPFDHLDHLYDLDQPDNIEIHQRWRQLLDHRDAVVIGEIYVLEAEKLRRYLDPDTAMHLGFWFPPCHMDWTVTNVREVFSAALSLPPGKLAWVTGTHDVPRAASRYGGGDIGRLRAMTMQMLQWGMKGMPFVYQGEELGLENARLGLEQMQDPLVRRNPALAPISRDQARTPMPWATGEGMGFTSAAETWLPFGGWTAEETWEVQQADEGSWLHAWRRLIHAWRDLPALPDAVELPPDQTGPVIDYRRGVLRVVANTGDEPVEVSVTGGTRVAFHRDPAVHGQVLDAGLVLPPGAGVWLLDEVG
ncbi:MAG TPA: alpha-amylase family glycosyl hydrolase [Euzebya sp.]|nr:alpha-amylase family glycosyl hydrolase [Euzebya sp.]